MPCHSRALALSSSLRLLLLVRVCPLRARAAALVVVVVVVVVVEEEEEAAVVVEEEEEAAVVVVSAAAESVYSASYAPSTFTATIQYTHCTFPS
jgi:hypothetical protein